MTLFLLGLVLVFALSFKPIGLALTYFVAFGWIVLTIAIVVKNYVI